MRCTVGTAEAVAPKMPQVKCSVHNVMYILLLHTRTAVVVFAEVPGINSTR